MRKRYETVIYDLDGTLLNTLDDLKNAVNAALGKRGYAPRTQEEVRLFVGNNVLQILTIHVEREIDSRFDNAQDKRRTYILTLENVALVANSGIHFTT